MNSIWNNVKLYVRKENITWPDLNGKGRVVIFDTLNVIYLSELLRKSGG